jgi:DNA repair protein RAD16
MLRLLTSSTNPTAQAKESTVCGICQEIAEDPIMSKCKHVFCREDIREYIVSAPDGESCTCPICFVKLSIDLSQPEYAPKAVGSADAARTSIVNYIDMSKWRSSTKIEGTFGSVYLSVPR